MTFNDKFKIRSMQDLEDLIDEAGFVPFFANEIEGFSIEELQYMMRKYLQKCSGLHQEYHQQK